MCSPMILPRSTSMKQSPSTNAVVNSSRNSPRPSRRPLGLLGFVLVGVAVVAAGALAQTEALVDEAARAALLRRGDGRIAHIETEYNDIYISKRRGELTMSFQLKGWDYTESVISLRDLDDLPVRYTRNVTVPILHPPAPKKGLLLRLSVACVTTYLCRAAPVSIAAEG